MVDGSGGRGVEGLGGRVDGFVALLLQLHVDRGTITSCYYAARVSAGQVGSANYQFIFDCHSGAVGTGSTLSERPRKGYMFFEVYMFFII